jgi:hypothetical protein
VPAAAQPMERLREVYFEAFRTALLA